MLIVAALAGSAGDWTVLTPANGSVGVDCHTSFTLRYKKGALDTTVDTETVQIYEEGTSLQDLNDDYTITIDGNTVTLTIISGRSLASETNYSRMVISGFTDASANPIETCDLTSYHFRTEDK